METTKLFQSSCPLTTVSQGAGHTTESMVRRIWFPPGVLFTKPAASASLSTFSVCPSQLHQSKQPSLHLCPVPVTLQQNALFYLLYSTYRYGETIFCIDLVLTLLS